MKPRAFIGSSVEGLKVAYAIQQNLLHEAEITVWSQGVFHLSSGTVDDLIRVLSTSDFGIFVFTPDDIATIRGTTAPAVRDNVLFELGLFLGKLGRERAFFVVPDNVTDLHLPTDLIGVSPGKYEAARSDGNLQAGTGPVSNQIAAQMKTVGLLPGRLSPPSPADSADKKAVEKDWFDEFVKGNHGEAKQLLEMKLEKETGTARARTELWLAVNDMRWAKPDALATIESICQKNRDDAKVIEMAAAILTFEDLPDVAVRVVSQSTAAVQGHPDVRVCLAQAYQKLGETDKAERVLNTQPGQMAEVAITLALADLYGAKSEPARALQIVAAANHADPMNENLRARLAKLASDNDKLQIALHVYDRLTKDFPKDSTYWGYLGNACLDLGLDDVALASYRRGVQAGDSVQWILANIGNLFSRKELPTEAVTYLEQAVNIERTQYALGRLSDCMKEKEENYEKFTKVSLEGLKELRALVASAGSDGNQN